jgi:hypothetical protein
MNLSKFAKKKERNIDMGRTLLHSGDPVMNTQLKDGDGKNGRNA